MKYNKGDKILVDMESVRDPHVTPYPLWNPEKDVIEVEIIEERPNPLCRYKVDGYAQEINPEYFTEWSPPKCRNCDSDMMYHDKKKENFCPFCKGERYCE